MKKRISNILKTFFNNLCIHLKNIGYLEIIVLFLIGLTILISKGWSMDLDGWYIMSIGRYIYGNGFPTVDPLTIHEGLNYVVQQWAYALLAWPIYIKFKVYGFIVLEFILISIILYAIYKLEMVISNNKKLSLIITALVFILLSYYNFLVMRPQLFSYIFIILTFLILEKYIKNNKLTTLLWLIPISILQINFHAALWWLLFILSGPFVVELLFDKYILKKDCSNVWNLIIILIVAFLAGFINPYGIKAITYIFFSSHNLVSKFVKEMFPLNILKMSSLILMGIFVINILIYIKKYKNLKEIKISYFLLLFGTFIMMINAVKCISFFIICSIYPLGYFGKKIFSKTKKINIKKFTNMYITCFIALLIVLGILSINYAKKRYDTSGSYQYQKPFLYLKELYNQSNITLYNDYNDGGYAEFIGFKTYIDTRAELFYKSMNKKDDIFGENYNLNNGKIIINDFLDKYKFTHLIISDKNVMFKYEKIEGYHLLKRYDVYKIYERDDFNKSIKDDVNE